MPIILITGASQGIGQAIAEVFSHEPEAKIGLIARNRDKLEGVAQQCEAHGAEVKILQADVTKDEDIEAMRNAVLGSWGVPDVIVNNAGLFQPGSLLDMEVDAFKNQVDVNLTSAFLVTKAFLKEMVEQGRGALFYMASVASIRAYAGGAAYCAAKHGLLGLARCVREETREHGIRVTTLLPGATFTPSWEGVELPEERFMPASDIARSVIEIYKLSDRTVVEEIVLRPQLGDI